MRSTGSPRRPAMRATTPRGSCRSASTGPHDAPGEHQAPGRRIDEQRLRVAEMRGPVARGDLVRDQLVGGCIVGNAQQRLRQAHQDYAFLRRQIVLAQERVEAGALHAVSCARPRPVARARAAMRSRTRIRQTRRVRELAHDLLLVAEVVAIDGGSDGSLGRHDDGSRLVHGRGSLHRSGRRSTPQPAPA